MTKTEKFFLGMVLISILYFVSPSGSEMTGMQWVWYIVGTLCCVGFTNFRGV